MNQTELIVALGRLKVETGSLACLGCGYEHNCSTHGCAIIREAAERLQKEATHWVSCSERLPDDSDEMVLVMASGFPTEAIELLEAYELATYNPEDGWILEDYPDFDGVKVSNWHPLPDPPKEATP